jgi:hypothetical protein
MVAADAAASANAARRAARDRFTVVEPKVFGAIGARFVKRR